jgi:hypothetical protein
MCLVTISASALVWYTLLREDRTEAEIRELSQRINGVRQETGRLRSEGQRHRAVLATYREDLAETGQLPTETPIEAYFQVLSGLASEHGLRVVRHQPLAERVYPGLREQRYSYEVSGAFPQLVAFLHAIESTDFWADVSYLKVEGVPGQRAITQTERTALLTISLFSAPPNTVPPEEGT